MSKYGLIIGRFQPFHLGHELLVNTSLEENPTSLILIGSSNVQDGLNPYDFNFRKQVIQSNFDDKILVGALPDFPSDTKWKNHILSYIPKEVSEVTLYCGDTKNDSAVRSLMKLKNTLPFNLVIKEIPRSIIPVSATQVRNWIDTKNTENLKKYLSEKTLLSLGIPL